MAELNDKQKRFIDEYMIDLNATQAAIRAGYAPGSADVQGPRLMGNVRVRARLDERLAERSKRTGINADRVLRELARIALVDSSDVIDFDDATVREGAQREDTAAIASIKCKTTTIGGEVGKETVEREIKLHDKVKALELLGKHLGMFTEKVKIEADITTKAEPMTAEQKLELVREAAELYGKGGD